MQVGFEAFNLLNQEGSDVEYYYESRLPSEPLEPINDVHFHPLQSRSVRVFIDWRP